MKQSGKLLIPFILICFYSLTVNAQCGINSVNIKLNQPYPYVSLEAITSLQPNWKIYDYSWQINNQVVSNAQSFTPSITLLGNAKISLNVFAMDTVTNDSCSLSRCNIFFIEQYIPLFQPKPVQINGNKVSIYVDLSGSSGWNDNAIVEWGDTAGLGQLYVMPDTISHTYADTGDKVIVIRPDVMSFWAYDIYLKVHVGNGKPNFTSFSLNEFTLSYDSAVYSVNAQPGYNGSEVTLLSDQTHLAWLPTSGLSSGYQFYQPGCYFTGYKVYDQSGGYYSGNRYSVIQENELPPDTVSGYVWDDVDADGIFDATESGIPGETISAGSYSETTDANGYYEILIPRINGYVSLNIASSYAITCPASNGDYYFNSWYGSPKYTNRNFGIANYVASACGKTFVDYNADSIYNSGDVAFRNVTVAAHDSVNGLTYYGVSDNNGDYCIDLPTGYFVLKASQSTIDSAQVYPDSIILNNPAGGINGNDFSFQSNGSDLGIILSSGDHPRPGFAYSINATVTNHRTDTCKANVVITFPAQLMYQSSQPAGGMLNLTNHTVTWVSNNIASGGSATFTINFTVAMIPLGTALNFNGNLVIYSNYTDLVASNNTYNFTDIVIGSFDPNDKLVTPQGSGSTGDVHHDTRLHYRINFQNTGTASAVNINVQDVLDADLDPATFLMERTSDPYTLTMIGNTLTWHFYNIYLPDSNINEPASHGFIEYSVMPKQGLSDGTIIENHADIYFDFNAPVVTNTTINTLQTNITGVAVAERRNIAMVFPVPTTNEVYISHGETEGNMVITLYDVAGNKVADIFKGRGVEQPLIKYSLRNFDAGVYFIKLQGENGVEVFKVVKR